MHVTIFSDYVCPYCYLAEPAIEQMRQAYGDRIDVTWNAYELRPEPMPLPPAMNPERRRRWVASILPMAAERGLVMNPPSISSRTRLAFQAVQVAREEGRFDEMHRGIFEALFRDGRDIENPDVLDDIGEAAGLAPGLIRTALQSGAHLDRVLGQERLARELGVTGVPAIFVGDDLATAEPVIGAGPYEWLEAAVERALSGASLDWKRRSLQSAIPLKEGQ